MPNVTLKKDAGSVFADKKTDKLQPGVIVSVKKGDSLLDCPTISETKKKATHKLVKRSSGRRKFVPIDG